MGVPNPAVCEKSRKFLDAESVTARRGQILKRCDRAAASLPPHPSTCRDSPPIAASCDAARGGIGRDCRRLEPCYARHGQAGVRSNRDESPFRLAGWKPPRGTREPSPDHESPSDTLRTASYCLT